MPWAGSAAKPSKITSNFCVARDSRKSILSLLISRFHFYSNQIQLYVTLILKAITPNRFEFCYFLCEPSNVIMKSTPGQLIGFLHVHQPPWERSLLIEGSWIIYGELSPENIHHLTYHAIAHNGKPWKGDPGQYTYYNSVNTIHRFAENWLKDWSLDILDSSCSCGQSKFGLQKGCSVNNFNVFHEDVQ